MPTHDIIDNRNEKLVDHINRILSSTEAARFAVGYFFLSGLTSIVEKLAAVKELRLLIGNTTNRETLEQLAEGRHRLELVAEEAEKQAYPKRTEMREMADKTADGVRTGMELMDQTDEGEALIRTLAGLIEEKRVRVRVYTKGRLHAKAYIFDYGKVFDENGNPLERHEEGIAIVGSSNLTLSGVTHNTELNVVVQGNDNHAELVRWFEDLWNDSQDFDEALMQEMQQSWALAPVRPYDIYMKTLHALVKDRLEDGEDREILWDDEITKQLADFQRVAVRQAVQIIRDYGGVFVSDVVGLGKSYVGAAVVKHFERTKRVRPLIICPAALVEMWERYNEVYQLNAQVLSMAYLLEDDEGSPSTLLDDKMHRDRDFLLLDESHNLRNPNTQRYRVLQTFLATGRPCCFLTATPRNKSALDVYHQIKLFHQDDRTDLPVDPPNLAAYFKLIEKGERRLPDLLSNLLIRRTRNHVLRWYGFDAETHQPVDPSRFREYASGERKAYVLVGGRHQFFPKRELETIEYSIEATYQGLYQELRGYLGRSSRPKSAKPPTGELSYARYGLWHYVVKDKQRAEPYVGLQRAGANLRGLIRVLLFKRFESSVFAFRETIRRLLTVHERFLQALAQGIVPAGEEAQDILYEPNQDEEQDLMDALRQESGRYHAEDFDLERLKGHIEHDINMLRKIQELVQPITPEQDDKLQTLKRHLETKPLSVGKRLIFTQYADTARYLFENLNPDGKRSDVEVIFSGDKSKVRVVGRFAPKANPEYKFTGGESELMTVVATDVLAEGLNLQDCDKIVNYDLHWNPVRLIQRFGRIDRIGTEHDVVWGFNFLPETGIERNLGLREKLRRRIQEIHDSIGEDSAILDKSEQLNEEAMFAIYEKNSGQLSLFDDEQDEFLDLNEAEEILRQLRADRPEEYQRIGELRDGIRTGQASTTKGTYVFCQAGRFNQLFLVDETGKIVSRDIPRILSTVRCTENTPGRSLPPGYNQAVMRVKHAFSEEVKHREAERLHTLSLTRGQKYALRELGILFRRTEDEGLRDKINVLDKAFRAPVSTAVNRELNRIRTNSLTGDDLYHALTDIYHEHRLQDRAASQPTQDNPIPKIICSEKLL